MTVSPTPREGGGGNGDPKTVAETATAVIGAITGAAALVVIPGALALLGRLDRADLPADLGVVVSLPTQFLLALGLTYVLFPLLGIFAIASALTVLPGKRSADRADRSWVDSDERTSWLSRPPPSNRCKRRLEKAAAIGFPLIPLLLFAALAAWAFGEPKAFGPRMSPELVPSVIFGLAVFYWALGTEATLGGWVWAGLRRVRGRPTEERDPKKLRLEYAKRTPSAALSLQWHQRIADSLIAFFGFALLVGLPLSVSYPPAYWWFFAAVVSVALWFIFGRTIARHRADSEIGTVGALGLMGVLVVVCFLPWTLFFAIHVSDLPQASVCTSDGETFNGRLIGETESRVYVGEPRFRVVSLIADADLEDVVEQALQGAPEPYDYSAPETLAQEDLTRVDLVIVDQVPDEETAQRSAATGVPVLRLDPRDDGSPSEVLALVARIGLSESPGPAIRVAPGAPPPPPPRLQPNERLVSIPSGEVTKVFIGGSGTCPAPVPNGNATTPSPAPRGTLQP